MAEMDARPEPDLSDPFEEAIDDALSSLPAGLRAAMSNVEIVVEDEPPTGRPLLGLYRGVPLLRRSSWSDPVPQQHQQRRDHSPQAPPPRRNQHDNGSRG